MAKRKRTTKNEANKDQEQQAIYGLAKLGYSVHELKRMYPNIEKTEIQVIVNRARRR